MADVLRTIPVPAENNSPFVEIPYLGLIGTDTLKLKAGWIKKDLPAIFRVKEGVARLVTDATVKNRNITFKRFFVNGDSSRYSLYAASAAVAASTTDYLTFGQIYAASAGSTIVPDLVGWYDMILIGDDYLELAINNNAAGDAWEAWIQFEFLNRMYGITGE